MWTGPYSTSHSKKYGMDHHGWLLGHADRITGIINVLQIYKNSTLFAVLSETIKYLTVSLIYVHWFTPVLHGDQKKIHAGCNSHHYIYATPHDPLICGDNLMDDKAEIYIYSTRNLTSSWSGRIFLFLVFFFLHVKTKNSELIIFL